MPWKALAALRYALRGIGFMLLERNAQLLAAGTVLVLGVSFWAALSRLEWCAVIAALALVWVAETLNTALERLTDLVSPQFHPLAGRAKDIAAAAVLLAMAAAVSMGLVLFAPRLF